MSKGLQHTKTIIFDFDGTIADTMKLGVEISNELSERYGYKKIHNEDDLNFYRNQTTQDALKAIGISLVKLPFVARSFRLNLSKRIHKLRPIDGIGDVLSELSKKYTLGLVTSNSGKNIDIFLKQHLLDSYFQFRATGIQLFNKSSSIKSIVRKHRLDKDSVIVIGDETRDIEAARKCKLRIVSVSWGFHTSDLLQKHAPDQLINSPNDLLTLLG